MSKYVSIRLHIKPFFLRRSCSCILRPSILVNLLWGIKLVFTKTYQRFTQWSISVQSLALLLYSNCKLKPCWASEATKDCRTYHARRNVFLCHRPPFSIHTILHLRSSCAHRCPCSEDQVWEMHNLRLHRCNQRPEVYMQELHHLDQYYISYVSNFLYFSFK